MRYIKASEGEYYEAKRHFNVWGIKKVYDNEGAGNLSISISEFLPNGGAELCASVKDRVYMVLRGELDLNGDNGEHYHMTEGDMVFIPAGENREIKVTGNIACRLLVIIVKAE